MLGINLLHPRVLSAVLHTRSMIDGQIWGGRTNGKEQQLTLLQCELVRLDKDFTAAYGIEAYSMWVEHCFYYYLQTAAWLNRNPLHIGEDIIVYGCRLTDWDPGRIAS